jgi:hypothetical protein
VNIPALQPLPGRRCGACTVCCVELGIEDPDLSKPDGVACPHLVEQGGCGVYDRRPKTCASWLCGWRVMAVLGDSMRPDRSRVLLVPEICREPGLERGGLALVPVGGDVSALLQREVVDLAGRCVAAGVPIFLAYGAGAGCKRVLVNRLAAAVVASGDRRGFEEIMNSVIRRLTQDAASARPTPES